MSSAPRYQIVSAQPIEGTLMSEVKFVANGLREYAIAVPNEFVGSAEMDSMITRILDAGAEIASALNQQEGRPE